MGAGSINRTPLKRTTDRYWLQDVKDDMMLGKVDSGMSDLEILQAN